MGKNDFSRQGSGEPRSHSHRSKRQDAGQGHGRDPGLYRGRDRLIRGWGMDLFRGFDPWLREADAK